LLHQENKRKAALISVLRNLCKSIFVFRYGFRYGKIASLLILQGIWDGIFERLGMRITPLNKILAS
jgi:hypothetical protein